MRGRGPLAVGLVTGLLHSGIGTVHTDTGGTVRGADLGTGYAEADRGGERLAATQAAVRQAPAVGRHAGPAAAVVPGSRRPRRRDTRARRSSTSCAPRGLAHLAVRLRDGVGVVGPLVYPGRTACLGCLDRTRGDLDPRWPAVAAQLAGRAGVADPAAVTATVGLAVAQAVAAVEAVDGGPPRARRHARARRPRGRAPPPHLERASGVPVRRGIALLSEKGTQS